MFVKVRTRAAPGAKQWLRSSPVRALISLCPSCHSSQLRNMHFPSHTFRKSATVKRSFQATWFNRFNWLHYNSTNDSVSCFTCCKAVKDGKTVTNGVREQAFLVKGFTNWKDGTRRFSRRESCDFHKVCTAALGNMLSQQAATEQQANREYLLKLFSSVRFLTRQGLALREDADEVDSNLHQLLLL